jgi:hypothetical protein
MVFTLYPPGYVPYGRVAMAPVDAEGQGLHEARDADSVKGGADGEMPCQLAWDTTIFRAARDGGRGLAQGSHDSSGAR